jgi:hypothetical protein
MSELDEIKRLQARGVKVVEEKMSERPQRHVYINDDTHVKYGETNEKQGYCLTCEQFSPCSHNALINQYEDWEKENPRLERLDYEKVKNFLYANADGIYTMDNAADVSKNICQAFGQPKDAVSVPTVEEIERAMWETWKDSLMKNANILNCSQLIHFLINRKLKGQYEDNTSPMR